LSRFSELGHLAHFIEALQSERKLGEIRVPGGTFWKDGHAASGYLGRHPPFSDTCKINKKVISK